MLNLKRNMKQWVEEMIAAPIKKPMPILSFPCVQLMGVTVQQLCTDAALQAEGMKLIAHRVDSCAAVSFMDLSVEAEAFGSQIRFTDDEIPTVVGSLVTDEEEADALKIPRWETEEQDCSLRPWKRPWSRSPTVPSLPEPSALTPWLAGFWM